MENSSNSTTGSVAPTPFFYHGAKMFPVHDFPITIHRSPQVVLPEHTHDFIEVVFVAGGRGVHQIINAVDGGSSFSYGIMQGDFFALLPGEHHTYPWHEKLVIYNVLFFPELLLESERRMLQDLPGLTSLFSPESNSRMPRKKIHLPLRARAEAEKLLNKAIEELALQKTAFRLNVKACLIEFLVLAGRILPSEWKSTLRSTDARNIQQAIYRAILYMERKIADPVTLAELADQAHLNQTYFSEQFKLTTGISPWNYLIQLRLELVKHLLSSTDLPISEIALRAGFCDSSYLAKTFRVREGMTPRNFRNKILGRAERRSSKP